MLMIDIVTRDSVSINITSSFSTSHFSHEYFHLLQRMPLRFMAEQQWHFGLLSEIAFFYWKLKDWEIKIIKAV